MPRRPLHVQLYWTARDYARRVWDNAAEDNIFFLAGGIAFNILLAAAPFVLLIVAGMAYVLNQPTEIATGEVVSLLDRLLPPSPNVRGSMLHTVLEEIIKARGVIGIYGALGFVWFSTRLFGSLRTVLASVFDIEQDRGIIEGKLFDVRITIIATFFILAYFALSAYLAIATSHGAAIVTRAGIKVGAVGGIEYAVGRGVAFVFITLMFFSLYKFLPYRRIRPRMAWLAAFFTSICFELARSAFDSFVRSFNPGSLYSGTIAAIVILVVWVYYAAMIFIIGGEVAQVYELRRVRRLQREALEDDWY